MTTITEIAPNLFRISSFAPQIAPPAGLTYNQFLVMGDEPLLFHLGHRKAFADTAAAVARILPLEKLRWLSFGHVEADECGAMNEFLVAAPHAQIVHGLLGTRLSINDLADRPARALPDNETLEIGGARLRFLSTPHIPHGWEAGVLFEETSSTLLCGDLFTHTGDGPPLTEGDIVGPAEATEEALHFSSLTPTTGGVLRQLAVLEPATLALMHGSSFRGDGGATLRRLAERYDDLVQAARARG